LKNCFPLQMQSVAWQTKLKEMIPSYGQKLSEDAALCKAVRERTTGLLEL
jgi:malate dehydrogenase (quinone)